ncbi:hypothetical protein PsYK624_034690 [Phanerochaete sordida]|uniref:Uncharacterized protein n=1 Tax=Phanerochaete sordida TaxID=48140 RepID=A0A9P3L9L0_9APHY|nr:hypothetical protein PsYK624_034690 [Phanerochaete sordida]
MEQNVTVFFIADGVVIRTWIDDDLIAALNLLHNAAASSKPFKYLIIDYDAAANQTKDLKDTKRDHDGVVQLLKKTKWQTVYPLDSELNGPASMIVIAGV